MGCMFDGEGGGLAADGGAQPEALEGRLGQVGRVGHQPDAHGRARNLRAVDGDSRLVLTGHLRAPPTRGGMRAVAHVHVCMSHAHMPMACVARAYLRAPDEEIGAVAHVCRARVDFRRRADREDLCAALDAPVPHPVVQREHQLAPRALVMNLLRRPAALLAAALLAAALLAAAPPSALAAALAAACGYRLVGAIDAHHARERQRLRRHLACEGVGRAGLDEEVERRARQRHALLSQPHVQPVAARRRDRVEHLHMPCSCGMHMREVLMDAKHTHICTGCA